MNNLFKTKKRVSSTCCCCTDFLIVVIDVVFVVFIAPERTHGVRTLVDMSHCVDCNLKQKNTVLRKVQIEILLFRILLQNRKQKKNQTGKRIFEIDGKYPKMLLYE